MVGYSDGILLSKYCEYKDPLHIQKATDESNRLNNDSREIRSKRAGEQRGKYECVMRELIADFFLRS